MLDSTKHNFREKILKCVQEGTDGLSKRTDDLEQRINTTSNDIIKKIDDTTYTITNYSVEKNYISSEYILDSLCASKKNKPRVLICGYYGARNLGDELMLQSLLKKLDQKKLDITIMLAPCLETDASIYAPYNVIHYPARNDDILLLAKNYDYIVWGGGAVLDDSYYYFNYLNNALGYILIKLSLAAFQFNKKVYVLGVSTNRLLEDRVFISDLQTVIDKADYFSLRDTNSLKTLRNANLNTKKINIIDDLVISNIPTFTPTKKPNTLCVSMTFLFDDANISKIQTFIKLAIKKLQNFDTHKKVIIHLTPFFDQGNHDEKYFKTILNQLVTSNHQNTTIIIDQFPDNIEKLLDIYTECDCVLSMRYHATLIASLCGIKTLSIDYGNSHRHYYNKLDYIEKHYQKFAKINFDDITNQKVVDQAINTALSQKTTIANLNKYQFPSIIKEIK